ncbi:nudix hydrolase 20, chloroplastic-like isoform X2 [Durio zibethinus]|uniref:Nudix hydrolase 20, chloroplastic-like isoform X2 n=1 Tax=Durio zibethinus TaxID=66656 RepID=A0A6P5ZBC1_DURZI|nr:nudix hydrolase 20, chloroplastic-like isoform X2 [Durio zibethinus]
MLKTKSDVVRQPLPFSTFSPSQPGRVYLLPACFAVRGEMAWNAYHLSHKIRLSISSFRTANSLHAFPNSSTTAFPLRCSAFYPIKSSNSRSLSASTTAAAVTTPTTFSWEDVDRASQPEFNPHDSADLRGFFDKIKACNRGSELQSQFLPFVIEDQIVGYIHRSFAENLRSFQNVFVVSKDNCDGGQVTLHRMLKSAEDRTRAVGEVIKCLAEKELIPGIRNELYPVTLLFGAPVFFSLERAAAPYFGIKAYGVHMNGYVEKDGQKFLWIGKRSPVKPTFPGMLDHLVAGGLSHGIACGENLMKECEEEAGIPRSLSSRAIPVGAVSYSDIDGHRFKRDVLFCYDLKLPEDGEVESFKLIPVRHVANVIKRTHFFKSNCNIVIIDFLFRHGYITPEYFGYLDLLQSLKSGDCS